MQLIIQSLPGQQFLMAAHFPDLALIEHDDLIGFTDSTESVRDHDRRAARDQFVDGLLYQFLRLRINRGCGFIQYQYRRVV